MLTTNLKETAEKMARAARAGLVIEKKRLQEILAEREKASESSSEALAKSNSSMGHVRD